MTHAPVAMPVARTRTPVRPARHGPTFRGAVRWTVGLVVVAHGLIHVLGVAEGFGWADVDQLDDSIGPATGVAWLVAAMLVTAAGIMLIAGARRWWLVGAVAAVVSQLAIATSWADARAGTFANVVLLAAVVHGAAADGPGSARARYRRGVAAVMADRRRGDVVTEADADRLPAPVAAYLRCAGVVGRPRPLSFRAVIHGRIRGGPDKPWMTFTGEQVNTFGPEPRRLFFMDATMLGLPVDVLHEFVGGAATMRVRLCSLVPMVDASGADLTRAETVTLLNDLCLMAPGALVDAPVRWEPIDAQHVRAVYTLAGNTVAAVLVFDDRHDLVDFVSDDRLTASPDGTSFTRQRWSTPVADRTEIDGRRMIAVGEGRWHPQQGEYCYLEFHLDDIAYDVANA